MPGITRHFQLWCIVAIGVLAVFLAPAIRGALAGEGGGELDLTTVVDDWDRDWSDTGLVLEGKALCMGTNAAVSNVQVFPIFLANDKNGKQATKDAAAARSKLEKFKIISLAAACQKRQARIKEEGGVSVYNGSGKYVYVTGGELLFGGSQDRMVACDYVIPPEKGKAFPIAVY